MSPRSSRRPDRAPGPSSSAPDDARPLQRLDAWLVYARFARTRSASARLIEGGYVRLNGERVILPARKIGQGDVLTLALPQATRVVRVLGLPERRGPFTQARAHYEDVAEA